MLQFLHNSVSVRYSSTKGNNEQQEKEQQQTAVEQPEPVELCVPACLVHKVFGMNICDRVNYFVLSIVEFFGLTKHRVNAVVVQLQNQSRLLHLCITFMFTISSKIRSETPTQQN